MNKNFLNLIKDEFDLPIYRVFTRTRFMEMFDSKKLTLVRPKLWDDPFENFMLNAIGELKGGLKFQAAIREQLYGQCWTLKRESDAIWRIYAPDKDGVKVKTTIRKLFYAIYEQSGEFRELSCFIGKVKYLITKKLLEKLGDMESMKAMLLDQSGRGQASTLLWKRVAFSHEKEVRLIYNTQKKIKSDHYHFNVDPFELFDRIVFDPRMDMDKFRIDKANLRNLGYKKVIVRSNLYTMPELNFKMPEL
jgi:Protein of unknown function (DUF2971)